MARKSEETEVVTVSGHMAKGSTWKSAALWRHWRTTLVLRFGFAHLSRVASTCPDASVSASPNLLHVRGNKFWRPLKIYFSILNLIISSGNGTVPTKWRLLTLLVSYQGSKNHTGNWQSMNYNREQMNIRWTHVHCSDGAPIAINLVMTVGDHYHKYNTMTECFILARRHFCLVGSFPFTCFIGEISYLWWRHVGINHSMYTHALLILNLGQPIVQLELQTTFYSSIIVHLSHTYFLLYRYKLKAWRFGSLSM